MSLLPPQIFFFGLNYKELSNKWLCRSHIQYSTWHNHVCSSLNSYNKQFPLRLLCVNHLLQEHLIKIFLQNLVQKWGKLALFYSSATATMPFFYLRATAMCTTFLVRTSGAMAIKVASTDFKACTGTTFKWMDHNYLHIKLLLDILEVFIRSYSITWTIDELKICN